MKLRFLLFLLLGCGLAIQAQELKVLEFRPEMSMVDAVRFPKNDLNGERCGLILLGLVMPDAVFEGDIISSEYKEGEWWIYMPKGSNWLTIKSLTHVPLRYEFEPIQSNVTYLMTVVEITGAGGKPKPTHQYLAFQITPTNAILEVNGQLWEVGSDGSAMKFVSFGTYNYRVQAPNYHAETGIVIVNDPENTQIKKINLKSDFVEVTLKVDADAEIWVNNEKKGTRTWTGNLGKGTYKIECKQAGHETSVVTKEITAAMERQTVTLPAPRPVYGALNVESTPNFCKLYIDGKDMGTTPKSIAEIHIGQHEIRLTKDGYADYVETISITKGERKQVKATLSNGREIQFICNVPDAQLEIDGQRLNSANGTYMLTYGNHSLKATATDYQDYTYTLNVSERGGRSHSITMQAMRKDVETFTVNGVSFTMKLVEGGTFQMGSNDSDAESDEKPVHSVTLSNYYIGETEVTQALWKAVMGSNPSSFKGDNLPVEQVDWYDCQEFIRKLNQKTGKSFRLPTEAEWEYAARGGKKSKGYKYAGSNNIGSVAWYTDNSGSKTHAVKGKSPNELGLYDMSGNVYEWCSDWHRSDYYGESSSVNPQGPPSYGSGRVLRGGDWCSRAGNCRVSNRYYFGQGYWFNPYGFRLCLSE